MASLVWGCPQDKLIREGKAVGEEILGKMLAMEQELRMSKETQDKYREAEERSDTDWIEVTVQLQRQVRWRRGGRGGAWR